MSTIFAVLKKERDTFNNVTNVKRYDIAHRYGIGGGKVGIKWLSINFLDAILLFNSYTDKIDLNTDLTQIKVHAMDNTAQGVNNIGDLMTLDKHGTLKFKSIKSSVKSKKKPAVKAVKYNMLNEYKSIEGVKK